MTSPCICGEDTDVEDEDEEEDEVAILMAAGDEIDRCNLSGGSVMASIGSNKASEVSGIDLRLLFPPVDRRIGGDRSPPSEVRRFTFFKGLRTSSILTAFKRQQRALEREFSQKE